ncbi:2653_t:CDS:2 [Funneliformis caledonium]|uniref:2653_t:CDS:1 n=1 Tax=Funneliformis caledonium TaxID=1117310 RepID=A0A9N8YSM6_9GLOM|nr:2653_t:CDS:2 [Funneliformis caledonium]
MSSEVYELTPSGRIKKPSYTNVANSIEDNLVFDYDSLQKKKNKKTELIHIDNKENQSNNKEEDSHDSDTDNINEYEKQEIDYNNEYDS